MHFGAGIYSFGKWLKFQAFSKLVSINLIADCINLTQLVNSKRLLFGNTANTTLSFELNQQRQLVCN